MIRAYEEFNQMKSNANEVKRYLLQLREVQNSRPSESYHGFPQRQAFRIIWRNQFGDGGVAGDGSSATRVVYLGREHNHPPRVRIPDSSWSHCSAGKEDDSELNRPSGKWKRPPSPGFKRFLGFCSNFPWGRNGSDSGPDPCIMWSPAHLAILGQWGLSQL